MSLFRKFLYTTLGAVCNDCRARYQQEQMAAGYLQALWSMPSSCKTTEELLAANAKRPDWDKECSVCGATIRELTRRGYA